MLAVASGAWRRRGGDVPITSIPSRSPPVMLRARSWKPRSQGGAPIPLVTSLRGRRWARLERAHLDRQGVATRGFPRGELRRRVRDCGADSAAAMHPAAAASGVLLAAMAKNSSRHTPRAYALSRREAYAPRRGGRMRNDAARDAFRGPEIKLLMPCVT